MLTDHPASRLPLDWERNQIRLLMQSGEEFICPWTKERIGRRGRFDLDHIVPVAIYPSNELWNVVPSSPGFNRFRKRDLLPSERTMQEALPFLNRTYEIYLQSPALERAIREDAGGRFSRFTESSATFPAELSHAVAGFISRLREGRLARTF